MCQGITCWRMWNKVESLNISDTSAKKKNISYTFYSTQEEVP